MVQRVRCPCCGRLAWPSQIEGSYKLEEFKAISLGKSHGFKHELSEDSSLVDSVKLKIKRLYERFFHDVTFPSLAIAMAPLVSSKVVPRSQVLIYPKVVRS